MITGAMIGGYSPLVPTSAQWNTSTAASIAAVCGTSVWEECSVLEPSRQAVQRFRAATPGAGAYFNEADYFEPDFQESFWGADNYRRLLEVKADWDPAGLFHCHNCVGSELWTEDGMCHL